jgi:hypothetical protein
MNYKALLLQMKLGTFDEQILAKERLEFFIEELHQALNHADLALATALENEDMECRNDEDCDHCVIHWAYEHVKKINKGFQPTKDEK